MSEGQEGSRVLWIVSGPGSVGKSTFLQSPRCQELTGLPAETPVIWPEDLPSELRRQRDAPRPCYVHYSLFRRFKVYQQQQRRAAKRGEPDGATIPFPRFEDDPRWFRLARARIPKRAVVLVAAKATIMARMETRAISEAAVFRGRDERPYNAERLLARMEHLDLLALYNDWLTALRDAQIPYLLIGSEDTSYPVVAETELSGLLGDESERRCRRR